MKHQFGFFCEKDFITRNENRDVRILLVDDEPARHFIMKKMLGNKTLLSQEYETWQVRDFIIDTVDDGLQAVDKVKSSLQGERYDIIFMDLEMPNLDGFGATELIHGIDAEVKIICCSSLSISERDEMKVAFDANVIKGGAFQQELAQVKTALQQCLAQPEVQHGAKLVVA